MIVTVGHDVQPFGPDTLCHEAYTRFNAERLLDSIPVVEEGRPIGLVFRTDFFARYATRVGADLYGMKPITRLMDPSPLVIEANRSIEDAAGFILAQRPEALRRGFIIVARGVYAGMGFAPELLSVCLRLARASAETAHAERVKAEKASTAKSQFLANMSHELRTPLNAIIGFSDFIASAPLGPIQPPKYGEYIGDMHRSARHLLGLINDILDMAKIESGHTELVEEDVDLEAVIADAARMMRVQADEAGLHLTVEASPGLPLVKADPRALSQVVLNLVSNAVKFTPRGGRVNVSAHHAPSGAVVIAVEDTGIGIPEAHRARVFEAFQQVENALARTKPGTGLGLAIVKAIAKLHGGDASLESRVGAGTRVTITLPPSRTIGLRKGAAVAAA